VERHARLRTVFVKEFVSARRTYSCKSCALSVGPTVSPLILPLWS
jgi:hypothetical protein